MVDFICKGCLELSGSGTRVERELYKIKNSCPLWDSNSRPSVHETKVLPHQLGGGGAVVTQTDRPKSVRSRCVIEIVGVIFVLLCYLLDFFPVG